MSTMNRKSKTGLLGKILLGIFLFLGCDPSYDLPAGPLRLPTPTPPTHILRIEGVPSVFPLLQRLDVRRPEEDSVGKIVFFAIHDPSNVEALKDLTPSPFETVWATDGFVSANEEIEGLGRLVCYAEWLAKESETVCKVPNLPVLRDGWVLYALAKPAPAWVDVTLRFQRINVPEAPRVTIQPIGGPQQH